MMKMILQINTAEMIDSDITLIFDTICCELISDSSTLLMKAWLTLKIK